MNKLSCLRGESRFGSIAGVLSSGRMKLAAPILAIGAFSCAVLPAQGEVALSAAADRVESPLRVDMKCVGTLAPRSVKDIRSSNWTLGCETLDRDFANFDEYKRFLAPLGIKTIRLQAGWAKCEKEKGKYDFAWLDRIVDYARAEGLNILLETDYGNPIYEDGGGWDLAGGFPTGTAALDAWDAWVDAITRHFRGRVRDWAMWNEPDIGEPKKTPEAIAAFNVRTAKIVKRNIPDARIAGLSLAHNDPAFLEECLKAMGDGVKLFDWIIYHGYADAPESSYDNVERQKAVLAKYNPAAKMRQGENGCPSEMATRFALSWVPWTEVSQAKWDMRRMLGDLGHDVESSVFTICDFNHKGREINRKGLLRANAAKEVVARKIAYGAVQNVASVFDDSLSRVAKPRISVEDATIALYEYRSPGGVPVFVFWQCADGMKKTGGAAGVLGGGKYAPAYVRPGDSCETRPATFYVNGSPLDDPVWVDLLSGRVFEFPRERQVAHSGGVALLLVPVYDSPCLITERGFILNSKPGEGESRKD